MASSILVAYASQCGSTQEVAEAIADVIRDGKIAVDVSRVEDVRSIERYRAVVLGSAVHRGHLLPQAIDFVRRFCPRLREVPVAVFCMRISKPTPRSRHAYLDAVHAHVQPVSEASFTGRFDRRGAALLVPRVLASVVPTIDRRNWTTICAWAHELRVSLAYAPGEPRGRPNKSRADEAW